MIKSYFFFVLLFSFLLISFSVESSPKFLKKCLKKCKNEKNDYEEIICLKKCSKKYFSNEKKNPISLSDSRAEGVTANEIWSRFRAELILFLSQGSSSSEFKGLQLVPVDQPLENWDEVHKFISRSSIWGSSFSPKLREFSSLYEDFLLNLKYTPNNVFTQEELDLFEKLKNMRMEINKENPICLNNWEKLSMEEKQILHQGDVNQFKNGNSDCNKLIELEKEESNIKTQIQRKLYGKYNQKDYYANQALNKFSNYKKEKKFVEKNTFENFLNRCRNKQLNPFSLTVSERSTYLSESIFSSSFGFTCLVFSVNGKKEEYKLTTTSKDFQVKISAQSWSAINIIPNPLWFEPDVFSFWKNGPFQTEIPLDQKLRLIPKTLFFFYQPQIEFLLNEKDAKKFSEMSSIGFSLDFGVIGLNYAKSEVEKVSSGNSELYRVTVSSSSTIPQLIAVNNQII